MARTLAAILLFLVAAAVTAASAQYQNDDSVATAFFLDKDLNTIPNLNPTVLLLPLTQAAAAGATPSKACWRAAGVVRTVTTGSKMTLHFTSAAAGLLQRAGTSAIPFTSAKIPEILSLLSIPPTSPAAAAIRSTLAACEAAPLPGTEALLSTGPRQEYTMMSVRPVPVAGGDMVACHRMAYPYAVFACHATTAAVYAVELAGTAAEAKGEALAACHEDAFPGISAAAYEKLGVKPGSAPVCHFLAQDSVLWMRN
ncbi:unnamed protein product [Urochloa decumbens]|uniref:BURP domain-containing protein n=1 Tax=Urochloa decumbens TaxID=240449 RepID=A0ABC9B3A0_9POAL